MDFALLPVKEVPFALSRESLFFACAKKSNQKKAHPGGAPSALRAAGPQAGPEFSEGTSMCRPKTSRIVRDALRVFPGLLAAPQGPRGSNSQSNSSNQSNSKRDPQGLFSSFLDCSF
ncbi:MAG TPA: hypothetical protein VFH12_10595 [Pseudoxanthomonas sp.]|nr:hypothetical protein [Pseudoxanthomonas sp.]